MQKITPFLWYSKEAEEAASFYASVFANSRVNRVMTMPSESPSGPSAGGPRPLVSVVSKVSNPALLPSGLPRGELGLGVDDLPLAVHLPEAVGGGPTNAF